MKWSLFSFILFAVGSIQVEVGVNYNKKKCLFTGILLLVAGIAIAMIASLGYLF